MIQNLQFINKIYKGVINIKMISQRSNKELMRRSPKGVARKREVYKGIQKLNGQHNRTNLIQQKIKLYNILQMTRKNLLSMLL